MKEIIRNRNIVIFFLITTTSAIAFAKVDQDVCTLPNFAQRNQNYYDLSSKEDCLQKCGQVQNCTFHSWDHHKKSCTILIELYRNPINPKYFCHTYQEVDFKSNQFNDWSLIKLNDSDNFQCAAQIKSASSFYNLFKNVNMVKTWAFNQKRKLQKENVVVNVKCVAECWNLCRNCSFFSWNPKSLTCHYSLSQLWKIDGNMHQNKEGLWIPDKRSFTVQMDKCQEVVFIPNQCIVSTLIKLKDINNSLHASLNESACYFYNSCKNVNRLTKEEFWTFNQNEKLALNVKSVAECWNFCQNCSFFSWDTKRLTCHFGELVKQQQCTNAKRVY